MPTRSPYFVNAIGTPLGPEEGLHTEGLERHLHDQWSHGIHGILAAGTMGFMQLLADETYRKLAETSAEFSQGKGEVLVGAGDASLTRTRHRIEFLNRLKIDGVVVLSPYFFRFSPDELVDYFHGLADASRHPLYLYHLPVLTRVEFDLETIERIAQHRNIRGIKCSCDYSWTAELRNRLGDRLRVIVAQPTRVAELIQLEVWEHLDGIFSLAPAWTTALGKACAAGNLELATSYQNKLNELLDVIKQFGIFPSFSTILNARGIPGNFFPAPIRPLEPQAHEAVLEQPIVRELISEGVDASMNHLAGGKER